MKHRRSAPHVVTRSRSALAVALLSFLGGGVAIGGCPGPDPHEAASGGSDTKTTGPSSSEGGGAAKGSGGAGGAGGAATATGAGGKGGGMSELDGGCDSGMNPCCADTTSDSSNCGQCGYVCGLAGALQTGCKAGKCTPTCLPGFADLKHNQSTDDGCETLARRVFVTSAPVLMPLSGGLAGGDAICTNEANAAGLGTTFPWRAWLSDSTVTKSPAGWTNAWPNAYVLVDNITPVATNFMAFFAGSGTSLLHAIDRDPGGAPVSAAAVWTGTSSSGTATDRDCLGWSTPNGAANAPTVGAANLTDESWTENGNSVVSCASASVHLYCFEMATSG